MFNYKRFLIVGVTIAFGLCASNANAIIVYNEADDGDLTSSSTLGVLTGNSTIIGTLDAGPIISASNPVTSDGLDEFDYISFTINNAWFFDIDALAFGPNDPTSALIINEGGNNSIFYGPDSDVFGIMDAGSYTFQLIPWHNDGTVDYQVTIRSSQVPEPSIVILMASGLIAFGVVRRESRT